MNFKALGPGSILESYLLNDKICFEINDLLDKYGFCDGDMLSDLFYEYAELKTNERKYFDSHKALYKVLKHFVWPEIKGHEKFALNFKVTQHNPVWVAGPEASWVGYEEFTPRNVYVKLEDIYRIFDQVIASYEINEINDKIFLDNIDIIKQSGLG